MKKAFTMLELVVVIVVIGIIAVAAGAGVGVDVGAVWADGGVCGGAGSVCFNCYPAGGCGGGASGDGFPVGGCELVRAAGGVAGAGVGNYRLRWDECDCVAGVDDSRCGGVVVGAGHAAN